MHRYFYTNVCIDTVGKDMIGMHPTGQYLYVIETLHKGIKEFFYILSEVEIDNFTNIGWTKSLIDPRLDMGGTNISKNEEEEGEVDEGELEDTIATELDASDDSSDSGDSGSSGDGD